MYDELHRPLFHLPAPCDMTLEMYAEGGSARLVSLAVHELDSAWPPAAGTGE